MNEYTKWVNRVCRALSIALHPFMIPTYAILILLFGTTVVSHVPMALKGFFIAIAVANTILLPAVAIWILKLFGIIQSLSLQDQRDRIIPIGIVALCYFLCAMMLSDVAGAFLLRRFLFAAMACVLLAFVVNFFWKISLHMIGMGGLVAMLVLMNASGFGQLVWTTLLFLLLSGALGSARLYLGSHNLAQVTAGFCGGFAVATLAILFIP